MYNFNIIKDYWIKNENILHLFIVDDMTNFFNENKKEKLIQLVLTEIYQRIEEKRNDINFFRMITRFNDFNLILLILNDLSNNNLLHFFWYNQYDYIIRFMETLDNDSKTKIIDLYKGNVLERDKYFVIFLEKLLFIEKKINDSQINNIKVDVKSKEEDNYVQFKIKSISKLWVSEILGLFRDYNNLEDIDKKKLTQHFLKRWKVIDRLSELITRYEWYVNWEYMHIFIDNIDFIKKIFFEQTGKDLYTYKKLLLFFLKIYIMNWDRQYLKKFFPLTDDDIDNDLLINLFAMKYKYMSERWYEIKIDYNYVYNLINIEWDLYSNVSIENDNDDFLVYKRDLFVNSKQNYYLLWLRLTWEFANRDYNHILINLEKTLIKIGKSNNWLIEALWYITWGINWWYSTILDFLFLNIENNTDFDIQKFLYGKFIYKSNSILQERNDLSEDTVLKLEKFLNSINIELSFEIIKNYISELLKIDKNKFPNYYTFLERIIKKYYPDFFYFFE